MHILQLINMKKAIITLASVLTFGFTATAQRIVPLSFYNNSMIGRTDIKVGDGSALYGLTGLPISDKMDYYWDEHFKLGKVYFLSRTLGAGGENTVEVDSLSGMEVRIDLWYNRMEFKAADQVKILEMNRVTNVLLQEDSEHIAQFVNPAEFGVKDVKGLFKVISMGNNMLILESKELQVQRATYNAALDAGEKETSISKKNHFHLWDGSKLWPINSKKELAPVLESLGIDPKAYFKESKNKLKNEKDYANLGFYVFSKAS